ncbi:TonB-dependent receptor [Congregicoccus parvus]|uniref:TonB-dependent receptor n=1 Tax=Congregicoccus parvus TaxID=3081749 RepID=UPI003FA58F58
MMCARRLGSMGGVLFAGVFRMGAIAADEGHDATLPAFVVTATREGVPADELAVVVDRYGVDALDPAAVLAIDEALSDSAAFSLFRRSSSVSANPTAQGVSLRNIGPSGASRSLVLFDGVPLNDPFGGWVAWSKLPRANLGAVEIVRGGGGSAWGGAALSGVVQVMSSEVAETTRITGEIGAFGTRRVEAVTGASFGVSERAEVRVGGRWLASDGFFALRGEDRGPIDRSLDLRHTLVHGDLDIALGERWSVRVGGRYFDEERGNGTPFQRNASEETAAHMRLRGELRPGVVATVVGYAQSQRFESGFSAVNAMRTQETPSLDQFDVPATAQGLGATLAWGGAEVGRFTAGIDLRQVRGETREAFLWGANGFQRLRFAGGSQQSGGAFVVHHREWGDGLFLTAGLRVDHWRDFDGHRRETNSTTGATLRDESFATRDGWEWSPSLGVVRHVGERWRVRGQAYRAFRAPTLNERYRPFRVGNVATEANPALAIETLDGVEVGVDWSAGSWTVSGGLFAVRLDDAVANVTLSSTPALVQRQRDNLERVVVHGFEAQASWRVTSRLSLRGDLLLSRAEVREASRAPGLVGARLPQTPESVVTGRVLWQSERGFRAEAAVRAVSAQFEDDANSLRLPAATVIDLHVSWPVGVGGRIYFAADNLSDEDVTVGSVADGRFSFDAPRRVRAGVEWVF